MEEPKHPLRAYRLQRGITLDDAAGAIGDVTPATLSRIETGKLTNPGLDLLRRIAVWTGGEVTPNDFLPAPSPPSSEAAA